MALPDVVSHEQWRAARVALLAREKELTRARDALNADRRRLPMVEVTKTYVLQGPDGPLTLLEAFAGYRQLMVGHFMFDPSWEKGCPSCTAGADEHAEGLDTHLHARDTHLVYVSRAPLERIEAYKAERGWTFPLVLLARQRVQLRLPRDARPGGRPGGVQLPDPGAGPVAGRPGRRVLGGAGAELLPARGRPGVPHLLAVRARRGVDRRVVLLPGPHRAGPSGGVGAAGRAEQARRRAGLLLTGLTRPGRRRPRRSPRTG